ncbi:MAG: hypothetical protein ACFFDN_47345 [Candidatus Hodarchaeota archaeon]
MGWFDDVVDWVEDNVVDPIVDAGEDAVDWVEDNVVDPIVDAVDDIADYVQENLIDPTVEFFEDACEWITDVVSDVGDAIEKAWGDVTQFFTDVLDGIIYYADIAWNFIIDQSSKAWDWIKEGVDSAVDWLINAAETVYEFVVEEAIPWIVSLVKLIPAAIKAFGALLILPLCYLYHEIFGDDDSKIIEGIAEHKPRLMDEYRIKRISIKQKFVIFSDLHMYVEGDLDFFKNNYNWMIYRHALNYYADNNYHLIENGDVEDFWMRGGSIKGFVQTISEPLPWPYYSEAFESSAFLTGNQVHAFNVFLNNIDIYSFIKQKFHDKNKYTRIIGNHDDVWSDYERMDPIFNTFYPNENVNDFCTIERDDVTEIIISHGHYGDIFNMPLCNFAGKALTEVASHLYEVSFGAINLFSTSKNEWEDEWDGYGFNNELQDINIFKFVSFSEVDLYEDIENIYGDSIVQPYIILGHTHNPKDYSGVPNYMFKDDWNWNEYSNSGSVGMWEDIVLGLEINYPDQDVIVVAWKKTNNVIQRYVLSSYRYGDVYLKHN